SEKEELTRRSQGAQSSQRRGKRNPRPRHTLRAWGTRQEAEDTEKRKTKRSGDLFFQVGEEIEGVERLEVVEIGSAEAFEDGTIERGEHNGLVAVGVAGLGGARAKGFAELVLALFVALEDFAGAF